MQSNTTTTTNNNNNNNFHRLVASFTINPSLINAEAQNIEAAGGENSSV